MKLPQYITLEEVKRVCKELNIDGFVKSRHPVEKRGPGVLQLIENTGFPPSRE